MTLYCYFLMVKTSEETNDNKSQQYFITIQSVSTKEIAVSQLLFPHFFMKPQLLFKSN